MKIRDLGKAILDFELNKIPKAIFFISKAIFFGLFVVFALLFSGFCWAVKTYKSLWALVILACVIIFFHGLEIDCVDYCYNLINISGRYAIVADNLYFIISLYVGLVVSYALDKKLTLLNKKIQSEV